MTVRCLLIALAILWFNAAAFAEAPPFEDYCKRLQHEIQGRKHGFLAGNTAYYIGGFHASWELKEHETLGLTHPFHHDLRSRGVGLVRSRGQQHDNTGLGNDFAGWEFYKDTRVLYGSVIVDGATHRHPRPKSMQWRPDRMLCEYEVDGVTIREEKFIAANDTACTIITSTTPVTLTFEGGSFFGRHSLTSTATIAYNAEQNAIQIVEGGTTKCRPEADGSERVGPIMYQGMSTILAASKSIADSHRFSRGDHGERQYEFRLPCDANGVVLAWAMHDDAKQALGNAASVLANPYKSLAAKTQEVNRQLNEEVPWFRCSDRTFEDIYYYLWSLYLMYYIDVGRGWEREPHTQTAVNNFLGIHRYDATFQIPVGAWTANKRRYAYGNVLTWKHLFASGKYRKSANGVIAISDTKGVDWHSGRYGNELSEHVLGAWKIYEHTGDVAFLRNCYEGYFREVFWERISPFFSNHFEVAAKLRAMAERTGRDNDVQHWNQAAPRDAESIRHWFDQRWEAHGHKHYFGGPKNGMLMTTGFWHFRSPHFPREYAVQMTESWAVDRSSGFYGDFFPLAMSRQAMKTFATSVDQSFGYTPDTAYFTLSGMFRQRLSAPASRLTLNHIKNYNFSRDWNAPIAPEAYTRDGKLFGDQYSNFNAGKLLLILEGLAGIEYSIPANRLVIHDAMPEAWKWMEVRVPIRRPSQSRTWWTTVRFDRSGIDNRVRKSIRVRDCPLRIVLEPWTEGRRVAEIIHRPDNARAASTRFPAYQRYDFDERQRSAAVELRLVPQPQ